MDQSTVFVSPAEDIETKINQLENKLNIHISQNDDLETKINRLEALADSFNRHDEHVANKVKPTISCEQIKSVENVVRVISAESTTQDKKIKSLENDVRVIKVASAVLSGACIGFALFKIVKQVW